MTERSSFYRKLAYLGGIVVLAFPIVWLSLPETASRTGGELAQLRKEYKLSQANIGEIDPASETIKPGFFNAPPTPQPSLLRQTGKIPLISLILSANSHSVRCWHGL